MTSRPTLNRGPLVALSLAMLVPSLGTSIANVALPTLAVTFAAPMGEVQWVVLSYLLATTVFIIGAGRMGDRFGRRRVLLAGIAIFAAGSLGCSVAPNLAMLIVARAVQGLGAAAMMALPVALVAQTVPASRAGAVMGLLGSVSAVGTALGPSLGGALITAFGWPSLFVLLATTGLLAFITTLQRLPADDASSFKRAGLDFAGTLLIASALGGYALIMTVGGTLPLQTCLLLAGFSVLAILGLALVERRVAAPLIQLEIIRDRVLSVGFFSIAAVSTIVMATLVVGPFYLTQVLGLDAARTGLVMSTGPVVAALTGLPAGRLVDSLGAFPTMILGLSGVAAGAALMIILPGVFGILGYVTALALITSAYALFQAANTTSIMTRADADRRGTVSAILGLARNLGLVTGASGMGALFSIGTRGVPMLHLASGGEEGLKLTFAVAAGLAGVALLLTLGAHTHRRTQESDSNLVSKGEVG